jgi:myo-inositol 2-dehydrogenase/D-chiro-inositol 1-dehydrogenase
MLRVALFGAGRIGQVHARSIVESGEAELAWVCDPVEAAATSLAAKVGTRWSLEPQDALEDPSIDAVLVASATPTHTDLIRRSVLAGKKVPCEKPIDLDMGRIDACWTDIAGHAPFVMLGFNRRFDPSFREINRRVAAGEIGTIRALRVTSRDPQPPPAAYLALSGGMFRDMTIHDFDMARYFLGEIVEVSAAASHNNDPCSSAPGTTRRPSSRCATPTTRCARSPTAAPAPTATTSASKPTGTSARSRRAT